MWERRFATSAGLASATRGHAIATYTVGGQLNGTLWRIIDTIGFEDSCLPSEEVSRLFSAFSEDCMDGVDAFLFVVKWGRFKPEHERALDAFAANAGEDALRHTLLVFTHCDVDESRCDLGLGRGAEIITRKVAAAVGRCRGRRQRTAARGARAAADGARWIRGALGRRALQPRVVAGSAKAARRRARGRSGAFRAAVLDWRKKDGPLVVERALASGSDVRHARARLGLGRTRTSSNNSALGLEEEARRLRHSPWRTRGRRYLGSRAFDLRDPPRRLAAADCRGASGR